MITLVCSVLGLLSIWIYYGYVWSRSGVGSLVYFWSLVCGGDPIWCCACEVKAILMRGGACDAELRLMGVKVGFGYIGACRAC